MKRLHIALLIAELLCVTLLCIGLHLIFWQHNNTGGLICGIAAIQSVLIVLILVFNETEEKEEGPVFRWDFGRPADIIVGKPTVTDTGVLTSIIVNAADPRNIISVFHGIVERAWQHRWTLDNYDKVHITLKREVTSGKAEVMNVYWNTKEEAYTVQTTVNHPKTGRKQLNRRGLSQEEVFNLLEHPRAHTDKGYYKK